MNKNRLLFFLIIIFNISCSTTTSPTDKKEKADIVVTDAWVRLVPKSSPNSAGYMNIQNRGDQAVNIVNALSDVAKITEIHRVVTENDVVKMIPVEVINVPAGGSLTLSPENIHIMLMGIHKPLKEKQIVKIRLVTETGDVINVPATVKNR